MHDKEKIFKEEQDYMQLKKILNNLFIKQNYIRMSSAI